MDCHSLFERLNIMLLFRWHVRDDNFRLEFLIRKLVFFGKKELIVLKIFETFRDSFILAFFDFGRFTRKSLCMKVFVFSSINLIILPIIDTRPWSLWLSRFLVISEQSVNKHILVVSFRWWHGQLGCFCAPVFLIVRHWACCCSLIYRWHNVHSIAC